MAKKSGKAKKTKAKKRRKKRKKPTGGTDGAKRKAPRKPRRPAFAKATADLRGFSEGARPRGGPTPVSTIQINRAPVLTLWGAVVAERLGFDRDAALTLGKAVAGLNAQSKGRRLGIFGAPKPPERGGPPKKVGLGEEFWVEVCGRPVPGKNTEDGVRAVIRDKPIDPESVQRYLEGKFGEGLRPAREAMTALAASREPEQLEYEAYPLYERFRPAIEPGRRGWGQKGTLDLELIRSLADRA